MIITTERRKWRNKNKRRSKEIFVRIFRMKSRKKKNDKWKSKKKNKWKGKI